MSSTLASLALSDVGSPRFLSACLSGLLPQRLTGSFFVTTAGGVDVPTVPTVEAAVKVTLVESGSDPGDRTDVDASALGIGASVVLVV